MIFIGFIFHKTSFDWDFFAPLKKLLFLPSVRAAAFTRLKLESQKLCNRVSIDESSTT